MTNCSVCGKKITRWDDQRAYNSSRHHVWVCGECSKLLDAIDNTKPSGDMDVDTVSRNFERLRSVILAGSGNREFCEEILQTIDSKRSECVSIVKHHADTMAESFPDDGTTHRFGNCFIICQSTKRFAIIDDNGFFNSVRRFEDLFDYNVTEDGSSITSGRAGAAAVGAILAGAAGAVVGSAMSRTTTNLVSQLDIVLSYKGVEAEMETISLLSGSVEKGSEYYQRATSLCNQITSALKQILADNEQSGDKADRGARAIYAFSVADEILKFKKLSDDGIITSGEFEEQKRKLLSLDY